MRCSESLRFARRGVVAPVLLALGCSGEATDEGLEILPPEVGGQELADGTIGEAYFANLVAVGGSPPYQWSLEAGNLPPGLALEGEALVGVPEEAGRFAFVVRVIDSARTDAFGAVSVRIFGSNGPGSRCDSPTRLLLVEGRATLDSSLPASPSSMGDTACGLTTEESAMFVSLAVAERSLIGVAVDGVNARAGLLAEVCPAATALSACGTLVDRSVDSGDYLIVVVGPPGESVRVEVSVTPENQIPRGPPTCSSPVEVDLSTGTGFVSGTFANLDDAVALSCNPESNAEAVFSIDLDEAADLRITATTSNRLIYELRRVDCSGPLLGCGTYDPLYLPNVAAGTHFLVVEPAFADTMNYGVTIEKLPVTPRPPNDTCAAAQPVVLVDDSAALPVDLTAAVEGTGVGLCTNYRALYYAITIDSPSYLRIDSSSSELSVELLEGPCDGLVSLGCGPFGGSLCSRELLNPGTYWIAISDLYFNGSRPLMGQVMLTRSDPPTAPVNDACAASMPVVLAANGSAVISGTMTGATDEIDVVQGNCVNHDLADMFYSVELSEVSDISVEFTGLTSSDYQVALIQGGCATGAISYCSQDTGQADVAYGIPQGTVGVVVERVRFPMNGACEDAFAADFQVALSVTPSPPAPPNDMCMNAEVITLASVGSAVSVVGTTRGASDDVTTVDCPNGGGTTIRTAAPDVFYRVDIGTAARLRITTTTPSNDRVLSLHAGCASTSALACMRFQGALETPAPLPPGSYYLRVDHDSGFLPNMPADFLLNAELF